MSAKPLTLTCLRCGHSWLRRVLTEPKRCPRCTSPYWNQPYTRNVATERGRVQGLKMNAGEEE